MQNITTQPRPAWLTRAKTILRRLESEDLAHWEQANVIRKSIEGLSLTAQTHKQRLKSLVEAERQPNSSFANSQIAREQIAVEKEIIESEISEIDSEMAILKERLETANNSATIAAGIFQRARSVFLAVTGGESKSTMAVS